LKVVVVVLVLVVVVVVVVLVLVVMVVVAGEVVAEEEAVEEEAVVVGEQETENVDLNVEKLQMNVKSITLDFVSLCKLCRITSLYTLWP